MGLVLLTTGTTPPVAVDRLPGDLGNTVGHPQGGAASSRRAGAAAQPAQRSYALAPEVREVTVRMMKEGSRTRLTKALLNIGALAVGTITAVSLVTAFISVTAWNDARSAHRHGASLLVPLEAQVQFALMAATAYAFVAVLVAAPLWLLLRKLEFDLAPVAAALGFVVTMAVWILGNLSENAPASALFASGIPYAMCGAAAGLATWWARPR